MGKYLRERAFPDSKLNLVEHTLAKELRQLGTKVHFISKPYKGNILRLVKKNKFIEFGKAAKENSTNFHWDNVIQKYIKILN